MRIKALDAFLLRLYCLTLTLDPDLSTVSVDNSRSSLTLDPENLDI